MIIEQGNRVLRRPVKWDLTAAPPSLATLRQAVCRDWNITETALMGRQRRYWQARADFCRRAAALQVFSLPRIGRAINRDHTTVLHHVRKAAAE